MLMYDNCPNCFKPLNGQKTCVYCNFNYENQKTYNGALEPFTVLNNKYIVGRVLGRGGFGITYKVKDISRNIFYAVKEYMPSEYSSRSDGTKTVKPFADKKSQYVFKHGKEKYVEEARTLIKLKNDPIVVDILDYFEENNTAYLVMEFLDGTDLRGMAKKNGGKIDPDFAKNVFVIVASSLVEIHKKNILHRDLSPENIFITKNEDIKLIDFGSARSFVSTQNKGMSILLKQGFAPPEQYSVEGPHGPWSDVYALCATFYHLVSGKKLIDALFLYRGEHQPSLFELGCPVTKRTSDVIQKGMALDYKKRYKDFMQLLNEIDLSLKPKDQNVVKKVQTIGIVNGNTNITGTENKGSYIQKATNGNQVSPPMNSRDDYIVESKTGKKTFPDIPIDKNLLQLDNQRRVQDNINVMPNCNFNADGAPSDMYVGGYSGNVKPQGKGIGQGRHNPYIGVLANGRIFKKIPLRVNTMINIGRSPQQSHIAISGDSNISRIHCVLRFDSSDGKFYLKDVSANGTYFENGIRLQRDKEYVVTPRTRFYLVTKNHMLEVDDR